MTINITVADKPINNTYTNVTGQTSGAGTGAKFSVTKTNGAYTVEPTAVGTGYVAGDTITLLGTDLGGTVQNNLIITVSTVGANGALATYGQVGKGLIGDGIVDVVVDVSGTDGVDTHKINGKKADFAITKNADGIKVTSNQASVDFNLSKHERVVFDDVSVAYDLTKGAAGDIYRLLGAALGVNDIKKDYMGVGIWLKDNGYTDSQIAQLLLNTDVYKKDAGGVSNETFVKHVYSNVMGKQATLTEISDLVAYIETNNLSQADVLVSASNLDNFKTTVNLIGLQQTTGVEYTPYVG